MQTFQPNYFMPAVLISTIEFLPFYITFGDLDLGWRSLSQHEAKRVDFIFSHSFELNGIQLNLVTKQCKLKNMETSFE